MTSLFPKGCLPPMRGWVPAPGCGHVFSADVTNQMEKWLRLCGVNGRRLDHSFYLQIYGDGSVQLCEDGDGGNGIVLDLPDFKYCPLCGAAYRKGEDHEN